METTPQGIIDAYLTEFRRVNGDDHANAIKLFYQHTWYYLKSATRCGDGSFFTHPIATAYRRKEIESFTEILRCRKPALDTESKV